MTDLANIGQIDIAIDVDFYSPEEEQKLLAYPTGPVIAKIVQNGIKVPLPEFLTYYSFHRKRLGKAGYNNYSEIGRKIGATLGHLDDFIEFDGTSISIPLDVGTQERDISEHIGESIGLSVVNRIHGLTDADWNRIPELRGRKALPVFDYELVASDGKHVVQVETKGSAIREGGKIPAAIATQKKKIDGKKEKILAKELLGNYPYKASLRYGAITGVKYGANGNAKCWLVDPAPDPISAEPKEIRLINRMQYLLDWISIVSPQSQLTAALATRIFDLSRISEPFQLSGEPLHRKTGETFEYPEVNDFGHSTFFGSKSRVSNGPAGGVVVQISDMELFFLGFRQDLINLATDQDFEKLLGYSAYVGISNKAVDCVISKRRFESMRLSSTFRNAVELSGNNYYFSLTGQLYYSAEGLVFGVLPIPD